MSLDRRQLLHRLGLGLVALPLGCGGTSAPPAGTPDAGGDPDSDAPAGDEWASGGTVSMTDKATYPDPFTAPLATCVLVATTTEGPCNTATDLDREDVSEAFTGIPMRLALKVVDGACAPLAGAVVKIWHTNFEGIYSGQTPQPGFCSLNRQDYIAMDFFRGVRTTAADGTVFFDSCFPGWYPGRAIHVHFQIKVGGQSTRISQLFFPEAITTGIFAVHPEYRGFGQPDTTLATDGPLAGLSQAERDRLTFTIARMTDGAMLASKVITVA
jgi:protocatechuate 3,4-dioxygenase beta subunit